MQSSCYAAIRSLTFTNARQRCTPNAHYMNQIFSSSERIFTDVWSHFGNFQNAGKRWPKRYSVNPPLG